MAQTSGPQASVRGQGCPEPETTIRGGRASLLALSPHPDDLPALALGLRLLALAVVSATGVYPTLAPAGRGLLLAGTALGAVLALAQYAASRRFPGAAGPVFTVCHVGVWTLLLRADGGQGSAAFIGYVLEQPLACMSAARSGLTIAATASLAAYLGYAALADPPVSVPGAATVAGFVLVSAVLSASLSQILRRQHDALAASLAALRARGENLAAELSLLGEYLDAALLSIDSSGRIVGVNRGGAALVGGDARRRGRAGRRSGFRPGTLAGRLRPSARSFLTRWKGNRPSSRPPVHRGERRPPDVHTAAGGRNVQYDRAPDGTSRGRHRRRRGNLCIFSRRMTGRRLCTIC